ncbi:hypothetical protein PsorP6_002966 [Peronosclerospora sorghi]|uniref:Uncharacterized protein n=1 Tax=Peronosclerospora sorghi TaxID=230839 RepID=A0ACC0VMJ6_9STRA|nr:hypothetical protein PsorP6_002966 [Peronosclerospora sorghi]
MGSFVHVLTSAILITSSTSFALNIGDYFRPPNHETSGVNGTNATYRRSPCPALNTLANHGYLHRDGKGITHEMFVQALEKVYNVGPDLASALVSQVPETISLDYLGIHQNIEHDASIAHKDAYYGKDPMLADEMLAQDLFNRAGNDRLLTNNIVAATRKDRGNTCLADNPDCVYGDRAQNAAFQEAAVLLLILGTGDTISVDHARSFVLEEKIPDDYVVPKSSVCLSDVRSRAALLKSLSSS